MKKIIILLVVMITLVSCSSDTNEYSKAHKKIAKEYDNLELGHNLVSYTDDEFVDYINNDSTGFIYIGRPT